MKSINIYSSLRPESNIVHYAIFFKICLCMVAWVFTIRIPMICFEKIVNDYLVKIIIVYLSIIYLYIMMI